MMITIILLVGICAISLSQFVIACGKYQVLVVLLLYYPAYLSEVQYVSITLCKFFQNPANFQMWFSDHLSLP